MIKKYEPYEFLWCPAVLTLYKDHVTILGALPENIFQFALKLQEEMTVDLRLDANLQVIFSTSKIYHQFKAQNVNEKVQGYSLTAMEYEWQNGGISLNTPCTFTCTPTSGVHFEETHSGDTVMDEVFMVYKTAAYIHYLIKSGNMEEINYQRSLHKESAALIEGGINRPGKNEKIKPFCVYRNMCKEMDLGNSYGEMIQFQEAGRRYVEFRSIEKTLNLALKLQEMNLVSFVPQGNRRKDFLSGEKVPGNFLDTLDYYTLCEAEIGAVW